MSKKKKNTDEPPADVPELLTSLALQDTVDELEKTKQTLLVTIEDLKKTIDQQKGDQSDIYYYLNKKCDESFEVIAALEEQLVTEQADREATEKAYDSKIEEIRSSASHHEAKLIGKIKELENRLEMLNTFSEAKEKLDREMDRLQTTLVEDRENFSTTISAMENRFLVEREKIKKNFDMKMDLSQKELEASIDGRLAKKTQRTQIVNYMMKKELGDQSKHAEKLLEINSSIMSKDRTLQIELQLSQSIQEEMVNKLASYQRIVKGLNQQISDMEEQRLNSSQDILTRLDNQESDNKRLQDYNDRLKESQEREHLEMDEMWQFVTMSLQKIKKSKGVHYNNPLNLPDKLQESVLLDLVREVISRYPKLFREGSNNSSKGRDRQSKIKKQEASLDTDSINNNNSLASDKDESFVNVFGGKSSWDFKSDEKSVNSRRTNNNNKSNRFKSVSCQTEGKIILYPSTDSTSYNNSYNSYGGGSVRSVPINWDRDHDLTSMSSSDIAAKSTSYAHPKLKLKLGKLQQQQQPKGNESVGLFSQSTNKTISVFGQGLVAPIKLPKL